MVARQVAVRSRRRRLS